MSANRQRHDDPRIAELGQFIEGPDRGKAEISSVAGPNPARFRNVFVSWPVKDLTIVFQGAPGAGKPALANSPCVCSAAAWTPVGLPATSG